MSKLLINESPILVIPSLATKIGLNEAIFIQQLHYWLKDSSNIKENHKWVYNTYEGWQEQFPFWSVSTLRRIINKLEKMNLVIIGNYNKLQIDKTKWYRIDYSVLECMSSPSGQNEQTECSDWTDGESNLNRPLPEITTEITTEKEEVEEDHPTVENPFRFFEENGFGTIGGHISQKINMWCDDLSDELVLEAMKIAVERGAKSWAYVEKILVNWADKKIKTVSEVHALILAYKEKQSKSKSFKSRSSPTRTEKIPDWFDDDKPRDKVHSHNEDSAEKKRLLEERLKKFKE